MPRLAEIHRHPIKGFTAEPLAETELTEGSGIAFDRHFAFVSGNKEEVPVPGGWLQPRTFLMLCVNPELARFTCCLSVDGQTLQITAPDGGTAEVTRGAPETYDAANALLRQHFDSGPHDEIRLMEQTNDRGHWDFSDTDVSIINLATLEVISESLGFPIEKERFRGNLYIDGLEPWEEFRWPGCRLQVGDAELNVLRPIQRCAMTSTELRTGNRSVDVPKAMFQNLGHQFCGVYASVRKTGKITAGDTLRITETEAFNPYENLPDRVAAPSLWPRFLNVDSGETGRAYLRSPTSTWPLLEAVEGQAIKIHPKRPGTATGRQKIEQVLPQGWAVPELNAKDVLVSGPYGRQR